MLSTSISKVHLRELQMLISKMPLQDCCMLIMSEFGLFWSDISRAVRNARLPMTPASVACVLKKYTVKSLTGDELADIVTRLRLKSIAIRPRTWHVIKLTEQIKDEPINTLIRLLPSRIVEALKNSQSAINGNKRPQVQTIKLGDLIFISIQMVSNLKQGGVLYVASPPGQTVALVSTLHSNLLRACVQGLGYKKFEDACLNGKDIPSLLRIADNGNNTANVADMPEFVATPCIARGGIDFTNAQATKNYLSQMFGPAPPILDTLTVKSETDFFDSAILNKRMKVTLQIKSENTFSTLQKWAEVGAISPTSELFQVFHTIKSNQIQVSNEGDDE